MQGSDSVNDIASTLADVWGKDAVETDRHRNRIHIAFSGDVATSLTIDCDLGVSHCLADFPDVCRPSLVPTTFEDRCIYANRLNIALARVLGVAQHLQVLGDTLTLSDTRMFEGRGDIVEVCETQARDSISLMKVLAESLSDYRDEPDDADGAPGEADGLLCSTAG